MPREFCDWSDLYKTGKSLEPEDSNSRPVAPDSHKGGDKITRDDLLKDAQKIIGGYNVPGLGQPSAEQVKEHIKKMYPELATNEEELAKKEEEWNDIFNRFFKEATKPVDPQDVEWGTGKSFNSTLSEEEIRKRNAFVGNE